MRPAYSDYPWVLCVIGWKRRAWHETVLGALPAVSMVAWVCAILKAAPIAAVLFNLFLFALGIGTLVAGLRGRRIGVVKAGMLVLAAMILCRFFDSNLGCVLLGVAFILVGVGFLAANVVLLRWKGAVKA
jgi:hypothetical protein